ncbi:MAG: hypothetical protein JWP34_4569 [Massilia sp.]|nr:hypothetical protein [Massilia sp.]
MKPQDLETLAGVLTSLDGRVSMLASALRGMLDCDTLVVETIVIPPSGVAERSWHVEYHSVAVTSQSTAKVTVTSTPAGLSAPTQGPGTAVLGPNRCGTFNLAGHVLSVYGTAGDTVTISVFAKPQPPAWGA